jgi:hypothetical protein
MARRGEALASMGDATTVRGVMHGQGSTNLCAETAQQPIPSLLTLLLHSVQRAMHDVVKFYIIFARGSTVRVEVQWVVLSRSRAVRQQQ